MTTTKKSTQEILKMILQQRPQNVAQSYSAIELASMCIELSKAVFTTQDRIEQLVAHVQAMEMEKNFLIKKLEDLENR